MNDDIELILMRWGAWARQDGIKSLGYPRQIPTARLIPPELTDIIALPDDEALIVDAAVGKLGRRNKMRAVILFDYYVVGLTDGEIAKRNREMGGRVTVRNSRKEATAYVQAYLDAVV